MGNVFYFLLTMEKPFNYISHSKDARKMIKKGIRSHSNFFRQLIEESTDPIERALIHCISMCQVFDSEKRASASDVADYLVSVLKELIPEKKAFKE